MSITYKQGYLVVVKSWENDADYKATTELQVETLEEVHFWKEFCHCFSKSSWEGPEWCGNIYDEVRQSPLIPVLEKYKELRVLKELEVDEYLEEEKAKKEEIDDSWSESDFLWCVMNLVGLCGMVDAQWSRKVESFKAYEIPQETTFYEVKL